MFSNYMAKNARIYATLLSISVKINHAAYNDHSNNIATQPTVWEIWRDEIL